MYRQQQLLININFLVHIKTATNDENSENVDGKKIKTMNKINIEKMSERK